MSTDDRCENCKKIIDLHTIEELKICLKKSTVKQKHTEIWKLSLSEKMKNNKFALGYKHTKEHSDKIAKSRMKIDSTKIYLLNDEILIGLILSDASLEKLTSPFQNSRFMLTASTKHSELIDYIKNYLNHHGISSTHKTYTRQLGICINLASIRNPVFTEMRKKWYPEGKKIIPNDLKLTLKTVAWWFLGDGFSQWLTDRTNRVNLGFCTESFTLEENIFLQKLLDDIGLYGSFLVKSKKSYRIHIRKKEAVVNFMTKIEPYILPCFKYKIKIPISEA